ncbi:hypothetical protein L7F22_067062 [Adiantum nelumboides]|nr:hypothetical protein [Adiantum nelumboides]
MEGFKSLHHEAILGKNKDKVLTKWRSLKLTPYESIHKYVDKFWDLHLKATVYKKIDFEEQKQQFCAKLPEDMNEYVNSQRPKPISMAIHHTMVAARIKFQQGAKRKLKPMEAKDNQEYKGKNSSQNSSKGNSNNNKAKEKGVFKDRKKQKQLKDRALIGLLAGPRPPVETLRNWIRSQWGPLEAEVETIQALPKGHYLFVFKNADMAFSVFSHGQWVIRSSPLSLFRWNKDFNPERSALVNYSVWVEFPNLLMHYHSHLAEIGSSLRKVLGGRQKSNYVPLWHPQVLIKMDISVELPAAIDIFTDDGELFE